MVLDPDYHVWCTTGCDIIDFCTFISYALEVYNKKIKIVCTFTMSVLSGRSLLLLILSIVENQRYDENCSDSTQLDF